MVQRSYPLCLSAQQLSKGGFRTASSLRMTTVVTIERRSCSELLDRRLFMSYETNSANRSGSVQLDAPRRTGFPFWDLMFAMQKTSQQALSAYNLPSDRRYTDQTPQSASNAVEVIPLGEETLNVEAHTVQGNTVRLRRVVVETPVEKQVT